MSIRMQKNLLIVVSIIICSFVLSITAQGANVEENRFQPSWFNYKRDQFHFTLSNPLSNVQIIFSSIKQQNIKVEQMSVQKNGFWKSVFSSTQHSQTVKIISKGQNFLMQILSLQKKPIKLSFKSLNTIDNIEFYSIVDENSKLVKLTMNQNCILKDNKDIECEFKNNQKIQIFYQKEQTKNEQGLQKYQFQLQNNNEQQIKQFADNIGINLNEIPNALEIVKSLLTSTLSSLCAENSEYEGYQFYGLCSNKQLKEIERHYSLLTIDILFRYNPSLAAWLTENYLDLLEEKLFYSFSEREWVPIPQHIEVFLTYIKHIKDGSNLQAKKIKNKINKVIEIQNGLINNLLLSQVNHLSEEINYRQKNKVHPSILKMLNQVWKTDLPRARVSSIYAESFTGDFFYHEKNEKLETSVGKMFWLIKLINQHIKVIRTYGDSYQKQSLQQLISLSKVMNGYVLDDPKTQNGDFHSIVITENLRVYTKSLGYESLLPFTYGISPAFPVNAMLNLTTPIGLASLPLQNPKVKQTYNFRGNINLYFNYKILFAMLERCAENPKSKIYLNGLTKIIQSIQKVIKSPLNDLKNEQKPSFYTSWNPQGKGMASQNYLLVLNLGFLKNLNVPSNEKVKKVQQETK